MSATYPHTTAPPTAASSARATRWSATSLAGAVLSAFLASACCVGPLVLALLGVGGGALLVRFEPYRPYFAAVTLALLGAGFWLQHRRPARARAAGSAACDCPAPRASRLGRLMLWVATALVAGLLVFPYVAPLIWS